VAKSRILQLGWPNLLTLSRLGMAAVMLAFLEMSFPFSKSLALLVFVLAMLTDALDGYLARNHFGITSFGKLMDPLADKVIVSAAFVSFCGLSLPTRDSSLVPAWIVVVIISREFLVTGLRLLAANQGRVISAGQWGKHKTVWQTVAVILLMIGLAVRFDLLEDHPDLLGRYDLFFDRVAFALGLAVALITAVSGAIYFTEHLDLIDHHLDEDPTPRP
jgi:CDP-diacylglycerol--glycerol-3-phosphate 3-phosphatidyltransferase